MIHTLTIKVTERRLKGRTVFEGTVRIPGLQGMLQRSDGVTQFKSRRGLESVARTLSRRLGWNLSYQKRNPKTINRSAHSIRKRFEACSVIDRVHLAS